LCNFYCSSHHWNPLQWLFHVLYPFSLWSDLLNLNTIGLLVWYTLVSLVIVWQTILCGAYMFLDFLPVYHVLKWLWYNIHFPPKGNVVPSSIILVAYIYPRCSGMYVQMLLNEWWSWSRQVQMWICLLMIDMMNVL
jgi:hypothetical protein